MDHACRLFIERVKERARALHRSESGQAFVLWAFGLIAILGVTALTIDVGVGYSARADAQAAADAAGYAAAIQHLLEGDSDTAAAAAAYDTAAANGYSNSTPDTSVVVNIPPKSGPHAGDTFFVEVIINDKTDTYFASLVGVELWDVAARSVATASTTTKPYGIITLNPNVCQATNIDGSVVIEIDGAGTFTQSNCPTNAFHSQGKILVDTEDNDVVGGWSVGGTVDPPPSKGYPIVDPLAEVDPPTPPSSPVQTCPTFGGSAGVVTLEPGVYNCTLNPPGAWGLNFLPGEYLITGGIVVNGGGSVTFGAGEYTVRGEGIKLTGNGSITGIGVTFFVDEGSAIFTGTGVTDLEAPEEGPFAGILLFQYRDNDNQVIITGNAAQGGWGTVYAPEAMVDFSGNGTTSFQFISDTFYAHGNSYANIVYKDNFDAQVPYIWIAE